MTRWVGCTERKEVLVCLVDRMDCLESCTLHLIYLDSTHMYPLFAYLTL